MTEPVRRQSRVAGPPVRSWAGVAVLAGFVLAGPDAGRPVRAEGPRTWSDATGRFRVEATLIERNGETVRLRRHDGAVVELSVAKLSEADRAYLAGGSPTDPENPFKVVGPAASPASGATGEPDPAPAVVVDAVPPDGVRVVDLTVGRWTDRHAPPIAAAYVPARAPVAPTPAGPIRLGTVARAHEDVAGVVADPATGTAIVVTGQTVLGGTPSELTHVRAVDLATGEVADRLTVPGEYRPLAWDGATGRLAVVEARFATTFPALEVWDVRPGAITPVAGIRTSSAYGHGSNEGRSWDWAGFLAGDGLAAVGGERLTTWTLPGLAAGRTFKETADLAAAVSPDRTTVAVAIATGVRLFRADDLAGMDTLAPTSQPVDAVAFSPDGARLAVRTATTLTVRDLRGGVHPAVAEVTLPTTPPGPLAWVDDEHLWTHDRVVHVPSGAVVFAVPRHDGVAFAGGMLWFATLDGVGRTLDLVPAAARPADAADRVAGQIAALPPGPPRFEIPPGSGVALDLTAVPEPDREALRVALEGRVRQAGHVVQTPGDATLVVGLEEGAPKAYVISSNPLVGLFPRTFPPGGTRGTPFGPKAKGPPLEIPAPPQADGRPEQSHRVTITPKTLTLSLVVGGEAVWREQSVQGERLSRSIHLDRGQTVPDYVRAVEAPRWMNLARFPLPPAVERPSARTTPILGEKAVTPDGLR